MEDILFKQVEKQPSVSNSQQSESDLQHNISNNTSQLVIEQHDPEIDLLFQEAIDEEEAKHNRVCYYIRNGVLMHKWRPLTTPADQEWSVVHQIVVPKVYRSEILTIAHEHPLSGHLGVNKTFFFLISERMSLNTVTHVIHVKWLVSQTKQYQRHDSMTLKGSSIAGIGCTQYQLWRNLLVKYLLIVLVL